MSEPNTCEDTTPPSYLSFLPLRPVLHRFHLLPIFTFPSLGELCLKRRCAVTSAGITLAMSSLICAGNQGPWTLKERCARRNTFPRSEQGRRHGNARTILRAYHGTRQCGESTLHKNLIITCVRLHMKYFLLLCIQSDLPPLPLPPLPPLSPYHQHLPPPLSDFLSIC